MDIFRIIVIWLIAAWLSACAPTRPITQAPTSIEATSSVTPSVLGYETYPPGDDRIGRLKARINAQWEENNQKKPKRVFVGATVHDPVIASYVKEWADKIERVGNQNYPEKARREGLYGAVQLTVAIFATGSVENVMIDRSSGSKTLDEAAIKIAHLASPYAPFSEAMRKKVDVLSITRTWTFTRSDRVNTNEL